MWRSLVPGFIKDFVRSRRKKAAFDTHKKQANRYTREDLSAHFRAMGLSAGDVLVVHSSLKNLGYVEGGVDAVLGALQDVVTEKGTLVFPAFTIRNSMYETVLMKDRVFTKEDPVSTGRIPDAFRKLPGVKRSVHFTHSLAAWGAQADYITRDHHLQETNFGEGTAFGKLAELNAKVLGLGITMGPVTYYHVFEDLHPELFPGVYLPEKFSVRVDTGDGVQEVQQYVHNPAFHARRIDKDPAIEAVVRKHLLESGKLHTGRTGDANSWWIRTTDLLDELQTLYTRGKTIYNA